MNTLIKFLAKYHTLLLFLLLQGVSFFLIARTTNYQQGRLLGVAHVAQAYIYDKTDGILTYFSLKKENSRLQEENTELRNQLNKYLTTDTLRSYVSFDSLQRVDFKYLSARVINSSINIPRNFLTINVGSKQGVKPDMGVVSSDGVVGIVTKVVDNYALVLPVVNIDSHTSAMLTRSKAAGTLSWKGANAREAFMSDILQHVDVRVNDTVVTSGYSHIFPSNINIGVVESFEVKKGNFFEIKVKLAVDFNSLHNVYVVYSENKAELDSLYSN